ncbi:MAG: NUDIX hydrolase [bacterium]
MPPHLRDRALSLARRDGQWSAPAARDAATVVLLRDAASGEGPPLSTLLMRRVSTMSFAAGMYVFPGGGLDPEDLAVGLPWEDPGAPASRDDPERMSATPDVARGLVVCAVREVFEETGILLAVDADGSTPVPDDAWESDRRAVAASPGSVPGVLQRRGLRLAPRLVPLWTHWVTPEFESRRFDVRFFVAAVPRGQQVEQVSGEADDAQWLGPAEALARYGRGLLPMLPPTVATLGDLVPFADAGEVLSAAPARVVRPLMPHPRLGAADALEWDLLDLRSGEAVLSLPGAPAGSEAEGALGRPGGSQAEGALGR